MDSNNQDSKNDIAGKGQSGAPEGTIENISPKEPSTVVIPHVDKFGSGLFSIFQKSAGTIFLLLIVLTVPVTVALLSKEQDVRQRASFEPTAAPTPAKFNISGNVYEDTNNNGVHDNWELGPGGVKLDLISQNIKIEISTDKYGNYSFEKFGGLVSGTYTITLVAPAGFTPISTTSVNVNLGPDAVVDFGLKKSTALPKPTI